MLMPSTRSIKRTLGLSLGLDEAAALEFEAMQQFARQKRVGGARFAIARGVEQVRALVIIGLEDALHLDLVPVRDGFSHVEEAARRYWAAGGE
jgi:hypothetical protein